MICYNIIMNSFMISLFTFQNIYWLISWVFFYYFPLALTKLFISLKVCFQNKAENNQFLCFHSDCSFKEIHAVFCQTKIIDFYCFPTVPCAFKAFESFLDFTMASISSLNSFFRSYYSRQTDISFSIDRIFLINRIKCKRCRAYVGCRASK